MAVSNEDAGLPDLDDLLDPDIAKILDEADLMEAVRCALLQAVAFLSFTGTRLNNITNPSVPAVR